MAHRKFDEKFYGEDAQKAAQKYADMQKSTKTPANEVYVTGPTYIDTAKVLAGIPGAENAENYWTVGVEIFS